MIEVREAGHDDVQPIIELFQLEYGDHYFYPQYYDQHELNKLIFGDGTIMLVAVDRESGQVAGTASIIFSVSAYNDLLGEFGRLVVHPEFRGQGIGKLLMRERVARVEKRLHVGIVDNRATHTFSQRISNKNGFVPIGFIPNKLMGSPRESVAPYVQYFGNALSLRKNNPRVIPEVSPLAAMALENCGLPADPIVDDSAAPHPHDDDFEISQMKTEGFSSLLRIERGRIRHREVFGPVRLHYGMFQIEARHSHYLIARRNGQIAGGIGFMLDNVEKNARIFELITVSDECVRFLLSELIRRCGEEWETAFIEIDVSAYAPQLQRTLLELGFLPVSYTPAMVFHQVERLDVVKMAKLLVPFDVGDIQVFETVQPFADLVTRRFKSNAVLPRIDSATRQAPLFSGMTDDQRKRLITACSAVKYVVGEQIYGEGSAAEKLHLILDGTISLSSGHRHVADISTGQCLGETSLLYQEARPHSLTATAKTDVETAVFTHDDFKQLIRRNPDIGVIIYRNLAADVSAKLMACREDHARSV